jgi:glycosyltransferase involved in cell wall biosynthesis
MATEVEVIVIDDGSDIPLDHHVAPPQLNVTFVRLNGVGPGAARNAGIAHARAPVVLFTDDDTVPCVDWIESALSYIGDHPECVGVNGPVHSPRWDPLTESSIETDAPDHHWTCNIAYRRSVLVDLGGFRAATFRFAHAEDRDLGLRARLHGQIGFEERMQIMHTPRDLSLKGVYRQARWARDDLILYALHPELTGAFTYPARIGLIWENSTRWWRFARSDNMSLTRMRAARALAACVIGFSATTATVLSTPGASVLRRRFEASAGTLARNQDGVAA